MTRRTATYEQRLVDEVTHEIKKASGKYGKRHTDEQIQQAIHKDDNHIPLVNTRSQKAWDAWCEQRRREIASRATLDHSTSARRSG